MGWLAQVMVALLVGCGGPSQEDGPRSVPISPTVELGEPEGGGLRWVDLEDFVTSDSPAVPDYAQPLRLGMTQAEVRETLAQLIEPRMRRPQEVELEGFRVISVPLKVHHEVGLTAIIDLATDRLDQIDLSVPSDQALYLLTEAWGAPAIVTHPELGPVATWATEDLRVELARAPHPGRSVLKVRAADTATVQVPEQEAAE